MFGWVFLSLLKLSWSLVSVSAIDCTFVVIEFTSAFHCTVRMLVLEKLHVRVSAYLTRRTLEHSLWTLERSALLRWIAPLLRSSTLAGCYTFARLCSIAWYLRSNASPQSAPTDQKQLSIVFDFLLFIVIFVYLFIFSTCHLFCLSVVFNFY